MIKLPSVQADINAIDTWAKYTKKLCSHCDAVCCSLPVEVRASDLIRMELMDSFELEDDLKLVARRLIKQQPSPWPGWQTATVCFSRQ